MKSGKTTGEDLIPVELIENAGPIAIQMLLEIFNTAYTEDVVPDDWQKGIICPIYKKGIRMCAVTTEV